MKLVKIFLTLTITCLGLMLLQAPASAQQLEVAVEDLALDGIYAEQSLTPEISLAAETLASNDVAFAWLATGDGGDVQSVVGSLLEQLTIRNSKYKTVLGVSPDGFAIDSNTFTDAQQETLLDVSQESFANKNIASGLLQVNNNLPNSLASSSDISPEVLPDSSSAPETNLEETAEEQPTQEANSSGGLGIVRILIFAGIAFIAFKFFTSWLKRKKQKANQTQGPFSTPDRNNSPINIPGTNRSSGMKGGLGGILGSIITGMAGRKIGGSLGNRSNYQSKPQSTPTQRTRSRSGGNIFSGGKISRSSNRSRRGRTFSSRRKSSRSGKGRNF